MFSACIHNKINEIEVQGRRKKTKEKKIALKLYVPNFIFMKIFYVRAPQHYVQPSGVGTIKLTYTSNSAQPQTSIQYASTTPKVNAFRIK